ncbi:olfactory receptor 5A1-like [Chrysemys picta bellii]|uniref:olfactory receptor 5A1-like n=1 Tax=Chrysemys picta bellii TaxID=8478 RepID=UPI0032B18BA9
MLMENQTTLTEFTLLGLSNEPHLQIFLFLVFLAIYLITLLGNMMIMLVIWADHHLHTPMYFFLSNLSFLDICYSSVTVPQMLESFLAEKKTISVHGCIAQLFFFFFLATTECYLLTMMAYDRYTAICEPLNYLKMMSEPVCMWMAGGAWIAGLLNSLVNTLLVTDLHFCGQKEINHFCCELPVLLPLSCTDTFINEMVLFAFTIILGMLSLLLTLISYMFIISTILRIPSKEGRCKAFSTCTSHLIIVGLFYGTGLISYIRTDSSYSLTLEKVVSIQYSVLTPMFNPIIYSLKNNEVKSSVWRVLRNCK